MKNRWVISNEQTWVISRERRNGSLSSSTPERVPETVSKFEQRYDLSRREHEVKSR